MAELPDLTVFADVLEKKFKGRLLQSLEIAVAKKINVGASEIREQLVGKKLAGVERDGKKLRLSFEGGTALGLHLMLRGQLVEIASDDNPKYLIAAFHFAGGRGFAVTDVLKQAVLTLRPEEATAPDALEIGEDEFLEILAGSKAKVKTVLMDQHRIRGIGNSYADEILWKARISPFSVASAIERGNARSLYAAMSEVLKRAIGEIERKTKGRLRGEMKEMLMVHGASIRQSPSGSVVKKGKIGGRTTYYTEEQELFE